VRAQWAGRPFLWQAYPQDDGVHAAKLDAFHALLLADAPAGFAAAYRAAAAVWNGRQAPPLPLALPLPEAAPWQAHAAAWRARLLGGQDEAGAPDLAGGLRAYVREAG